MSKRLKILFIPRWYPNRVDPLSGVFIQRHAQAVALKHQVAVLYVNADPELKSKTYDLEFASEAGINIVRVYYNNSVAPIPVISALLKFYRYLIACRKGIRVIREKFGIPDVSHVHVLARTFLPAYYFKYFFNTPFIVTEQWSGYLPEDGMYKGFLKKIITRMAIRKASAVTTVSESLRDAMLAHGLKNTYSVIPNVVDIRLFFPLENDVKKEKLKFLHVSNLDDRAKNVSGMIRVMKRISEKGNDFEFHIIGNGPGRKNLEALAASLNLLGKNVFFQGTKNSSEIAEMMKNADLFLLFSNYDNMPCVMVESLASGLPVIGSAIHGISEHIKEGKGILAAPGDENAFCEAVLQAMHHIRSFDKMKLHTYASENFSYAAVSDQFDRIYQQTIKK